MPDHQLTPIQRAVNDYSIKIIGYDNVDPREGQLPPHVILAYGAERIVRREWMSKQLGRIVLGVGTIVTGLAVSERVAIWHWLLTTIGRQ